MLFYLLIYNFASISLVVIALCRMLRRQKHDNLIKPHSIFLHASHMHCHYITEHGYERQARIRVMAVTGGGYTDEHRRRAFDARERHR